MPSVMNAPMFSEAYFITCSLPEVDKKEVRVYFYSSPGVPLKSQTEEEKIMGNVLMALLALLLAAVPLAALAVETGGKAPDFEAESTVGTVKLSDYLGKKNVLLAFYFKDFTGG